MKPYLALLAALLLALISGCGRPKQQLNILISPEWLDPGVVADFERQFNCKVTLDFVDDPDALETKLANGGDALFDVVVPLYNSMPALIERGLLAPLRRENLPNFQNLDPQFLDTEFDPGSRYGAPYQWGILGLLVRKPKDVEIEESWCLVFDAKKQPGPFVLYDIAGACLPAALRFQGHDVNSTNLVELQQARDLMLDVRKRVLAFDNPLGCRNRVLAREAVMAMVSNVDGVVAMRDDPESRWFLPREGGEMWFDVMAVPTRAPHRDLAEKFINFILEAKVGARLANFNHAATPNRAARAYLDPAERNHPALYPSPEDMRRLWWMKNSPAQQRLLNELWTQIKAK